jgi:hypothetical protein
MKKAIVGMCMFLVALAAFALPSPKQIEDALAAQKYADAKSMVQEVLREKPDSARAHLLNAFLLVHVDHNKVAANSELQTAAGLDRKGDVKSSPLFGRVVAEIDMTAAPPRKPVAAPASNASRIDPLDVLFFILIVGGIVAAGILILRPRDRETVIHVSGGGSGAVGGTTYVPTPSGPAPVGSGAVVYPHAATTIVHTPSNPTMGAFGTAAAVAGGVVAGEMLADSLRHRRHDYMDDDAESFRRRRESTQQTYTPEPSPVSYEAERTSFSSSSGGGDSWGSSDSGSSSGGGSDW